MALRAALRDKDTTAAIYMLKNLCPEHYDERCRLENLKHKHRLAEIEKRAELGLPVNDEPITYNVVVTEAPMPDEPEGLH